MTDKDYILQLECALHDVTRNLYILKDKNPSFCEGKQEIQNLVDACYRAKSILREDSTHLHFS